MIKTIFSAINSRKFKYFLVFLAISTVVWFFGRLSEVYQSEIQLNVSYVEVPNQLFPAITNPKTIRVKVKAKGFALMRAQLNKYQVAISMSSLDSNNGIYRMSTESLINQVKSQLPINLEFLSIDIGDVSISMFELTSKKVAVKPRLQIQLMSEYIIDNMVVTPDSVTISGSEAALAQYCAVPTELKQLKKVNDDFNQQLQLELPEAGSNLKLSHQSVQVQYEVERYIDRSFDLEIQQLNTTDSILLKTFPSRVKVIAYALVKDLKEIRAEDFNVYVNAASALSNTSELLELQLKIDNPKVLSAYLMEKKVEYIVR